MGQNSGFACTHGRGTPVGVRAVNSGSKWKVSSGLPTAGLKGGLISFLYSFCGESKTGRWGGATEHPGGRCGAAGLAAGEGRQAPHTPPPRSAPGPAPHIL